MLVDNCVSFFQYPCPLLSPDETTARHAHFAAAADILTNQKAWSTASFRRTIPFTLNKTLPCKHHFIQNASDTHFMSARTIAARATDKRHAVCVRTVHDRPTFARKHRSHRNLISDSCDPSSRQRSFPSQRAHYRASRSIET